MKKFLDDNFLLENRAAEILYHEYAAGMPIVDYHCHLPPDQIADDLRFENLTQVWLKGDHYKWRAMRAHGIDEKYITGNASDKDKFLKWAETVPYTLRNPLYHWTHLELKHYFGVTELLQPESAEAIYDQCSEKLKSAAFSVRGLLRKSKVQLVCTTDDPTDSLDHHQQLKKEETDLIMLPAFRPDAAMQADRPDALREYIQKLAAVGKKPVHDLGGYLSLLLERHAHFAHHGCTISDHGLEEMYADPVDEERASKIFHKIINADPISDTETLQLKSFLLKRFAEWDHAGGWVQQYHLGALRNNNERMLAELGPDTGWDSIGDFPQGKSLSRFLNSLEKENRLAKTILYNLNPADNNLMATMVGNFNTAAIKGKMQWGSAWWFNDQKDGMIHQINTLSNMGLLSHFVGMLTDSRSFLSFPRHEYFRRLLCNLLGTDITNGELPDDLPWVGKLVQDICYNNAVEYFSWNDLLLKKESNPSSK